MKSLFILSFLTFFTVNLFSQSSLLVEGKLNIDSIYNNANEKIISQYIFEFPTYKKDDLIKKTKNWVQKDL